jgi:D-inositol-3-phosphate glycosyltransferase
MHILFTSPHSDPLGRIGDPDTGGQCIYEAHLAAQLVALDAVDRVTVATRWYEGKERFQYIAPGAAVRRYECGGRQFIRKEDLFEHLDEFIERLVVDLEPDPPALVHSHYWDGGVVGLAVAEHFGIPHIFTPHSLGIMKQDKHPEEELYRYSLRLPWETRVMAESDATIELSDVGKQTCIRRYGIDGEKIHIVPGGYDPGQFKPSPTDIYRRKFGIEESLVVTTLGRLDPRKGFHHFLRVVRPVVDALAQQDRRVRFFLSAGGSGNLSPDEAAYRAQLAAILDDEGIGDHVTWVNQLDMADVASIYTDAALFVCSSTHEHFGLVIVEAFGCGTTVVSTNQGGPVEIIEEGVDGYLVNPGDHGHFAERLIELLSDDEKRGRFAQAAYDKAVQKFTWHAVAARVFDVYRRVMARKRGA